MSDQDLIIIEQLPIITQQFRRIAVIVKEKVDRALAMPCTPETKQEVKKLRSDLNKDKADLEARRIAVKKEVLKEYDDMEAVYKAELLCLFIDTDKALKERIAAIEDAEKAEKEANVRAYFAEYAASLGLDIPYEAAGINMTLTLTEAKAKEQAKAWLDKQRFDVGVISKMEHNSEIMAEYRANGYDAIRAMKTVDERYAAIEREQQRLEAMKQQQDAAKEAEAKVDAVMTPVIHAVHDIEPDPNEIMTAAFTVTAPRFKLRALREYMTKEGIRFE